MNENYVVVCKKIKNGSTEYGVCGAYDTEKLATEYIERAAKKDGNTVIEYTVSHFGSAVTTVNDAT